MKVKPQRKTTNLAQATNKIVIALLYRVFRARSRGAEESWETTSNELQSDSAVKNSVAERPEAENNGGNNKLRFMSAFLTS